MSPRPGSIHRTPRSDRPSPSRLRQIHRRPRSDSGAVRLWAWARTRRGPWTCPEASEAADLAPRRTRKIVAALHAAELIDCVRESEMVGHLGQEPAQWAMSAAGRTLEAPLVLIVEDGQITGVRTIVGAGTERLRRLIERSGLSTHVAAVQLHVHASTLRKMLRGSVPIASDDPILERARRL